MCSEWIHRFRKWSELREKTKHVNHITGQTNDKCHQDLFRMKWTIDITYFNIIKKVEHYFLMFLERQPVMTGKWSWQHDMLGGKTQVDGVWPGMSHPSLNSTTQIFWALHEFPSSKGLVMHVPSIPKIVSHTKYIELIYSEIHGHTLHVLHNVGGRVRGKAFRLEHWVKTRYRMTCIELSFLHHVLHILPFLDQCQWLNTL